MNTVDIVAIIIESILLIAIITYKYMFPDKELPLHGTKRFNNT